MPVRTASDPIGERLVRQGIVSEQQLSRARADARAHGTGVPASLVRLGYLSEQQLTVALGRIYGVRAVDLERVRLDERVVRLLTPEMAMKHLAVPVRRDGRRLIVAMANPTDLGALDDLRFMTRCDIEPVVAGEGTLRKVLEREYDSADERINALLRQFHDEDVEKLEEEQEDISAGALQAQVEDAPVVRLINGILVDAVRKGASDIHVECYEREVRIRYRIDGALREVMRPPVKMKAALISRLKILSDLNIAERRLPQDGRIKLRVGRRVIDFRVSTIPTLFGEKIVLRILDQSNLTLDLEKFGMEPKAEGDFMRAIMNPYGMVLVTGPTGSGKTTTLYSALSKINTPDVNIVTAEDPVEYNLYGINQVQVRAEIGMTFAASLRAFLRQDPNVIMVGEIRDIETGGIAIKAALTGHLVLSTLHTNDAPSTITRMIDMGIEPFNVASAVNLITAQRLVRRICPECSAPVEYATDYLAAAGVPEEDREMSFHRGRGCDSCGGSGYKGRQGLYEVMAMSATLRRMILQGASTAELRQQAIAEGMLTLRMDGMEKVRQRLTTLEEVVKETAS